MSLICATNFLCSKKSSICLEWGESTIAFQLPCIQALLHESNEQLNFLRTWPAVVLLLSMLCMIKAKPVHLLGSHSRFLPSTSYYIWTPYTLQHTWMPQMANRKANLEFSLLVMLTNKCCIDSFVYSALSINHFQRNLILHREKTCEKLL